MATRIQLRHGTAAQWTSANPTLADGELGLETDTLKIKMGNGSTAWTGLSYIVSSGGATGPTGPAGAAGPTGPAGATGPTGADAPNLYVGVTAPSNPAVQTVWVVLP